MHAPKLLHTLKSSFVAAGTHLTSSTSQVGDGEEEEEEDEDEMHEIETDNILPGSKRTEGKHVDYAKAAQDAGLEDDDEEDDDEDFEPEDEDMQG